MSLDSILFNREIFGGSYRNGSFQRSIKSNESLVKRFGKIQTLKGHTGCVNTILFNESGQHVISGSDDKKVNIYDVNTGSLLAKYKTIHKDNIFFAKDLPYSKHKIITCAGDGKVVLMDIETTSNLDQNNNYSNCFHSTVLHKHKGVAHRICMIPQSSDQFYSCSSDGVCAFFDLRSKGNNNEENDERNNIIMKTIFKNSYDRKTPIYSIQVNPLKLNEIALSGSFQCSAIYDTRKFDIPISYQCPCHLINTDEVSITGMKYSSDGDHLISSYNDEDIYRININSQSFYNLKEMMLKEDRYPNCFISTSNEIEDVEGDENLKKDNDVNLGYVNKYIGHRNNDTIKQVSVMGLDSEFVVSGSDCGNIFIWNTITSKLIKLLKGDNIGAINCLNQHPSKPMLASCGLENTSKIWGVIDDQSDEDCYDEIGRRAKSKDVEHDRQQAVMRSNLRDRSRFQHDISIFALMNMISRDEITLEDLSIAQFDALRELITSQGVLDENSDDGSIINDNIQSGGDIDSSDGGVVNAYDSDINSDSSNDNYEGILGEFAVDSDSDNSRWSTCSDSESSNEDNDSELLAIDDDVGDGGDDEDDILSACNNVNIEDSVNNIDNDMDNNDDASSNDNKGNNKRLKMS
jgi:WD repeat-containing protein 42A